MKRERDRHEKREKGKRQWCTSVTIVVLCCPIVLGNNNFCVARSVQVGSIHNFNIE